jgi:hypothetical protein
MNRPGELPTQIGNLKHLETSRFNNELEGDTKFTISSWHIKTLLLSSNKFYGN